MRRVRLTLAATAGLAWLLCAGPIAASCPTQLVTNGGFESGTASWTYTGSANANFTSAAGDAPCEVFFGDISQSSGAIGTYSFYQDVTIPAGSSSATLAFQYRVNGGFCTAGVHLWSQAYIKNPSNNATLATVLAMGCCNQVPCGTGCPLWIPISYNALSFAGQPIRLWFQIADGNGTCIGIGQWDCISLLVCAPSPTTTRTPSGTRTTSATPTPTPTATATDSETATATTTETETASPTVTPSESPTVTESGTALPTHTVSATATRTVTSTASASPTKGVTGGFAVYPNPARRGGAVRFAGVAPGATIAIWNVRGERLGSGPLVAGGAGTAVWAPGDDVGGILVYRARTARGDVASGTIAVVR